MPLPLIIHTPPAQLVMVVGKSNETGLGKGREREGGGRGEVTCRS